MLLSRIIRRSGTRGCEDDGGLFEAHPIGYGHVNKDCK